MRILKAWLGELPSKTFDLGFVGEKNHTKVIIRCSSLFDYYPDAVPTMAVTAPSGEIYPKEVTRDDDDVIWEIAESDIASSGSGEFQLTFTEGEEVVKVEYGRFSVKPSMIGSGDPPDPVEDWLTEANEALADLKSWQDVEVTGTTPSITGEANKRYVCGEVSTLSITPPESGMIDVVFTSGSTATVLTATGIVFPEWFDSTRLDANTRYEINVLDGYGVVTSWATI